MQLSTLCKVCNKWIEIIKDNPEHIKIDGEIYHKECVPSDEARKVLRVRLNRDQYANITDLMRIIQNVMRLYSMQLKKATYHFTDPEFKTLLHKFHDEWSRTEDFHKVVSRWFIYLDDKKGIDQ